MKYIIVLLFMFVGCNNHNNIYDKYPLDSILTKDILKSADQIIPTSKYLILTINYSKDSEQYNPHLLFYKKNHLKSACLLPGNIDSITKGIIFISRNDERLNRKEQFVNDLPPDYKFFTNKTKISTLAICNKIIKRIIFDKKIPNEIHTVIKVSTDEFAGYDYIYCKTYNPQIWNVTDTIPIRIHNIIFESENNYKILTTVHFEKNGILIRDKMIIKRETLNEFYDSLWLLYNTQ